MTLRTAAAFGAAILAAASAVPAGAQQGGSGDPKTWPLYVDGINSMTPYQWLSSNQNPPLARAVAGGSVAGQPLYVCRGPHKGGVHPGKLWHGMCHIGWGGAEVPLKTFEVLVRLPNTEQGFPTTWVPVKNVDPKSSFYAGLQDKQYMRPCRARMPDGVVHPGKEWAKRCNVGYGGKEIVVADYEVLVLPNLIAQAAHGSTVQSQAANDKTAQTQAPQQGPAVHSVPFTQKPITQGPTQSPSTTGPTVHSVPFTQKPITQGPTQSPSTTGPTVHSVPFTTSPIAKPNGETTAKNDENKKQLILQQTVTIGGGVNIDAAQHEVTVGKVELPNLTELESKFFHALPPVVTNISPQSYPSKPTKSEPACGGWGRDGKLQPPCGLYTYARYEGPAKADCDVAAGEVLDYGTGACYKCPAGYGRTGNAVTTSVACSRPDPNSKAVFGRAVKVGDRCPPGTFFDGIRGGECFKCPDVKPGETPWEIAVAPHVDAFNKCFRPARTETTGSIRHGRATGLDCPSGQVWNVDGYCYSCPADYTLSFGSCTRTVSEQHAYASVVKRAVCEGDAVFDLIDGGSCWKCPDGFERTSDAVDTGTACVKPAGVVLTKAEFRGYKGCAPGQEWDALAFTTQGEVNDLIAKGRAAKGAKPAPNSATCWKCPANYSRFTAGVKSDKACVSTGAMEWKSQPYPEPGLFGMRNGDVVAVEYLRNLANRGRIELAIATIAQKSKVSVASDRPRLLKELRDTPHKSPVLFAALLGRIHAAIRSSSGVTSAEKSLLAEFGKYLQARRTYTAEDAMQAYQNWKKADDWIRLNRKGGLELLFDIGAPPPDYYEVIRGSMIAGLSGGAVLGFGIMALTREVPALRHAIWANAKIRDGIKVMSGVAKSTGGSFSIIGGLGTQLVLTLAVEALVQGTDITIERENADDKIRAILAEAKQPVDFARMMKTDEGTEGLQTFWMLAMSGEVPPSAAVQREIATAIDRNYAGSWIQPESSSVNNMCLGIARTTGGEVSVATAECDDEQGATGTGWQYLGPKGALVNGVAKACLDLNGTTAVVAPCDSTRLSQQWTLRTDGTIQSAGTGACLGPTNTSTKGAPIVAGDCARAHKWKPAS